MGLYKAAAIALMLSAALVTTGCQRDATVASRNLSSAADNFELDRRIVFYNGITGSYMLSIEGKCSFDADGAKKVDVTCKIGEGKFKKHSLGLSDNVTYFSEQVDGYAVSTYHYKVDFKPELIVPDIDLKTSLTGAP